MSFTKVLPSGISSSFNLTVDSINSVGVVTATSIVANTGTFSGNVSVAGTLTYEDVTNIDSIGIITARSTIDAQGNVTVGAGLSVVGVSTLGNTVVGGGTTELVVTGDARITGILTIGTASITIDGSTGKIGGASLSNSQISAIESSISSTAVDVFVYDTRKDSDGGAWRKRTQHTSWYNETLNTATRGSRRDFPAVAVIVRESGYLKIYDGDDPDMPMWMIFEANNNTSNAYMLEYFTTGGTSVTALNGIIVSGHNSNGATTINFINEKAIRYRVTGSTGTYDLLGSISQRNTPLRETFTPYANTIGLVNSAVNDVAMTVLPNAPIDAATGLPVPTIAVATNGGVSVIKDDGTVVDLTCGQNAYTTVLSVSFNSNNDIIYDGFNGNSNTDGKAIRIDQIPSADIVVSSNAAQLQNSKRIFHYGDWYDNGTGTSIGGVVTKGGKFIAPTNDPNDINFGESIGVSKVKLGDTNNRFDALVSLITTSYNTGWMHGDIKGAFLSDTSTASVTTELISNGDFSSALDTNVWSNYPSASNVATYSIVSGELQVVENNTNNYGIVSQYLTGLTVGKQYVISVDSRATTGTARWFVGSSQGAAGIVDVHDTTSSTLVTESDYWTAVSTDAYVNLAARNAAGATAYFDNITVKEAELDRSVNNKGLQVFGTVTKTPVAGSGATAAELVAYSGFSASNYLQQPYNSAIAFGTANFSYMGWAKATTSGGYLFQWDNPNSTNGIRISMFNSTTVRVTVTSVVDRDITYSALTGTWNFFVVQRVGSIIYTYVNGVQIDSFSNTTNLSGTDKVLTFGYNGSNTLNLALWRVSASIPSPTQILKIYNDEKALFQENSQCTLYGTSSAVTALAYDDTTRLLSVGTSSGRSDFQGLERINNTTTAVTTAISASNSLIAEQ